MPEGVFIDRKWLLEDTQCELQYCPQVGDKVVYFPQGHLELLQRFPENRPPPWLSFGLKWPVVQCIVRDVSFDFPTEREYRQCPSVLARVTLGLCGTPSKQSITSNNQIVVEFVAPRSTRNTQYTEHTFEVTIRNFHGPDCIVPYNLFARSLRVPWKPKTPIFVHFKEQDESR